MIRRVNPFVLVFQQLAPEHFPLIQAAVRHDPLAAADRDRFVLLGPVAQLVLKGKSQALMVYEPLVAPGGAVPQRDAAYEAAYDLLRRRDAGARAAFEHLARERAHDPLVRLHLRRLEAGEEGDTIVLDEK